MQRSHGKIDRENVSVRSSSNVELHLRSPLRELSSSWVWFLNRLSSSNWIWIDQHVLSVCIGRKERVKIDLFVVMIKFQIVLFEISLTEILVFAALNLARRIMFYERPNGRTLPAGVDQNCSLVRLMWSSTFEKSLNYSESIWKQIGASFVVWQGRSKLKSSKNSLENAFICHFLDFLI